MAARLQLAWSSELKVVEISVFRSNRLHNIELHVLWTNSQWRHDVFVGLCEQVE